MTKFLRTLLRYALLPAFVLLGALAIAAGLCEGPPLQPFLYGVF